jgi:outer membrane protein assembly factor BamD
MLITYLLCLVAVGTSQAQIAAPYAGVEAQPPDKALFEQATWAMETSRYAEARALLVTLIDSHPDSDYVPRAKVAAGDAWYAEGSFKQAEMEYRDFITFFPDRPEVAEAQRKLDSIQEKSRNPK